MSASKSFCLLKSSLNLSVCRSMMCGEIPYSQYYESLAVCGVNGEHYQTFYDMKFFECHQSRDVNLKLKHKGICWEWELRYGIETYQVLLLLIFFILVVVAGCWGVCRAKRAMWKKNKPFSNVLSA